MRLASLFTGGKDSTYATHLAIESGEEVAYLVTLYSKREDSWMFHTVNIHLSSMLAQAFGIESVETCTSGEKEKEVEDLKRVLRGLDIDGVVSGSIASKYQKKRVDRICNELGLSHFTPLWGRNGQELLDDMLKSGLVIMITAVAAQGLGKEWLGMILDSETVKKLRKLNKIYSVDICGEGGEMETLVLDAPWFHKKLEIVKAKKEWDGMRGSFKVIQARLKKKYNYT